jgi:hypothetical protein
MSAQHVSRAWLMGCSCLLIIGWWMLLAPQAASGQPENPPPSCLACHTMDDPVVEQGEWHTIHAFKKCCCACHGGNDCTADQESAHAGLTRDPLDNTYQSCHQCHANDYQQRGEIVAVALGHTPGSHVPTARPPVAASTPAPTIVTLLPRTSFRGWGWPVELAVAIVAVGLGVMRWRRVHSG